MMSRIVISTFAVLLPLLASAQPPLSEMVDIPAGSFMMGSNDGPEDERPAHQVTLAAFLIDRFPVTNTQYANFLRLQFEKAGPTARLYDYDDPDARIHRQGERWVADPGFENHPKNWGHKNCTKTGVRPRLKVKIKLIRINFSESWHASPV